METSYIGRHADDRSDNRREARPSMAAPAILIGSLILIVGTFLDWASGATREVAASTTTDSVDLNGINLPDGRVAAGIGLALLVIAALMWANKRVGSWFDADLLGVALSTVAVGVIITFLISLGDDGRSAEIGTYVSLAGAAVAMIGAVAALLRSGSDRATSDGEGRGDVERRAAA